ncbi:MAG: protease modulator HflC, partial [Methyloceanibacter sp.]
YRSMQAYEGALQADDTRLLLSPSSQFFQYFNDAFGNAGQGGATPPSGQPAEPAEKPNAPAGDGESEAPEQGAAAGDAATPERDVSAGESLPQAPQAP